MEIKEFIKINKGNISSRLSDTLLYMNEYWQCDNINEINKKDFKNLRNCGQKTIDEFIKLRDEMPKQKTDSIVERVVNQFKERSKRGIEKYGTTLQENNTDDFLQHFKEELMDAILYIQKLQSQRNDN